MRVLATSSGSTVVHICRISSSSSSKHRQQVEVSVLPSLVRRSEVDTRLSKHAVPSTCIVQLHPMAGLLSTSAGSSSSNHRQQNGEYVLPSLVVGELRYKPQQQTAAAARQCPMACLVVQSGCASWPHPMAAQSSTSAGSSSSSSKQHIRVSILSTWSEGQRLVINYP
jgi:hypothetical protein